MLLLICNGSLFVPHIKMVLSKLGVAYTIRKSDEDLSDLTDITGVLLSGGPGAPQDYSHAWEAVLSMNVPILGICMGHELIGNKYGAIIDKIQRQERLIRLKILEDDSIFSGVSDGIDMVKLHSYCLHNIPEGFKLLASSHECPIEVLRHITKPIYTFQGHPELAGEEGIIILKNFLRMCGHT